MDFSLQWGFFLFFFVFCLFVLFCFVFFIVWEGGKRVRNDGWDGLWLDDDQRL